MRVDATVEHMRIFVDVSGGGNNQRPDILLRNPGQSVVQTCQVAVEGISFDDADLEDWGRQRNGTRTCSYIFLTRAEAADDS